MPGSSDIEKASTLWLSKYAIAHRGLHNAQIPENSLQAFDAAASKGYAIELDVRLSKDDEVVVFHDKDLARMTGCSGSVHEHTMRELADMRLLGTGQAIPTLTDALSTIDCRVPVLIELKCGARAGTLECKTCEILRHYDGEFAVQSFSPLSMRWFRINAPHMLRGQLTSSFDGGGNGIGPILKSILKNLKADFLSRPDFISCEVSNLDNPSIRKNADNGLPIIVWVVRSQQEQDSLDIVTSIIFEGYEPIWPDTAICPDTIDFVQC